MGLKCGIVGLPNVGKSTLFNALTKAKAESANYPFCTIEPNVGVVAVPDTRLDQISEIIKPEKTIPTSMEFVDIAGLVKGAASGEGLGNQFLSHIRQTDAILHVLRCFEDTQITHVHESVDPLRDIEVINTELLLADLDTVQKRVDKIEKVAKSSKDKQLLLELSFFQKVLKHLEDGHPVRSLEVSKEETPLLKELHFITAKPVLYICNTQEEINEQSQKWIDEVQALAKKEGAECLAICSSLEAEVMELSSKEERLEFLSGLGWEETGLDRLIQKSYSLLKLCTYFTAGPKEVRAWTVKENTLAPQAAGVIHSDFEKGFIRAETYHCQDLFDLKSETKIKESGKYRSEGKTYPVKDGDVLFFQFNV